MGEKIMKRSNKTLTATFAVALVVALFASAWSGSSSVKAEEAPKVIDMYLIAGQSNAVGYSPIPSGLDTETFDNVWYAGMTEKVLTGAGHSDGVGSDSTQSFEDFKKYVTGGMGVNAARIGPEYGIAKTINDMYADEGKQAIIFKTAAGGTSLLDNTLEFSERYGNWYPRSLWGDGYDPDITGYSASNDPTGLLYKLFVENFRRVYSELVENGYQPVVKGMAWMQGETNLYANQDLYGETLRVFVTDIRNDLIAITGDKSLLAMPFVIGKIAPTFGAHNNSAVPGMHEQQESVAEALGDSVATVDTDDLIIVDVDGKPAPGCPDLYHFCFNDALTLGQRFGEKIVELNGQTLVTAGAQGGKLGYAVNGNTVLFTLTPDTHYHLQSLTVDGEDVTASVVDGSYTLTDALKRIYAEAVFTENERLALTYADLGKGAGYLRKATYWYKDEILSVKIFVNDGYTLEKVTFNGEPMTYNEATGEYEVLLTEEGEVAAVVTENATPPVTPSGSGGCGCGSVIAVDGMSVFAVLAAAVLLVKRRIK